VIDPALGDTDVVVSSSADRRRVVRRLEVRRVHDELRGRMFGAEVTAAQVGRFALRRRLGAGATGVVYAAYDPQLDREVAVKLVIAELDELAEARALARCSHPNLLPVYEVGSHDGVPFIVSELVEGGSLRGWLETPRAPDQRLAAVIAIGRGIAEAHRRGVVHRDLKPDNVLIGGEDRPRVADFGLARRFGTVDDGPLPGTPAYMAPEQRAGELADPRSDQYSYAVLAYEVLFGTYPSMHDRSAGPGAHALVSAWPALTRALALLPEARWPNLDAMVEALVPAPAPAPPKSRAWTVIAALCAVVVIAIVVEVMVRRSPARAQTPDELDFTLMTQVGPMMQNAEFDACVAHLRGRVLTDAGRNIWLACAQRGTRDEVDEVCAAWRGASPSTVPSECDDVVTRLRELADAGQHLACLDLGLGQQATTPVVMLVNRCAGEINTPKVWRRVCVWTKRQQGDLNADNACGFDLQ